MMGLTAVAATTLALSACGGSSGGGGGSSSGPQTITVAVVNNPQMADIQKLTKAGFEASHPKIHVKYVTLDENTLRDQVTKDVAAGGGQFDVVMIGPVRGADVGAEQVDRGPDRQGGQGHGVQGR